MQGIGSVASCIFEGFWIPMTASMEAAEAYWQGNDFAETVC